MRCREYLESRNFNLTHESTQNGETLRSSLASRAVESGRIDALRFLLERGADVNVL